MIIEKLIQSEITAKQAIKTNVKKLGTIRSIRILLEQIDFSSEVIPIENKDRLIKLIQSLKGSTLSGNELALVEELSAAQYNGPGNEDN